MGNKYIIEIPEDKIADFVGSTHFLMPYMMAGHIGHHDTGLPIAPYTEPDMEQVRKEGYKEGREAGIKDGKCEAWEAARKICLEECDGGMQISVIKDIFNVSYYRDALRDYSASEAIEKIRAYEQEKEEQIQVGDEVEAMAGNAVVIEVIDGGQTVRYMYPDTITGRNKACNVTRTGRHFPQIAEVLQKMKENNDNK